MNDVTKPRMLTCLKIILLLTIVIFFDSCKSWDFHGFPFTRIKQYPKNKPFVYKTNIRLSGKLSKTERSNLESRLKGQLEDSVSPKSSQKIFWQVMKKPPAFDTSYVQSSRKFMLAMLHSSGYFKGEVNYDTSVKRQADMLKLTLNFNVTPGPLWHFDSVWYSIQQPELQRLADSLLRADTTRHKRADSITIGIQQPFQKLADSTARQALLKKGSTFSQDTIAMELDRLVELFRNNGYMRFTRNELIGVWDTLDVSVLQPLVNPLEQIEIINSLAQQKENPQASLEIKLRPGYDSAKLVKFYVGKIYIFPDFTQDSTAKKDTVVLDSSYTVIYSQRLFKPKILPLNVYLRHGQVYRQQRYINTLNRFNSNVAWRLVNIEQRPRPGIDTVDFFIKLIPSRKYLFVANLEGSRDDNSLLAQGNFAQGNLLGVGVNLNLQNRNFARSAAQTNTSLRYGTELSISNGQQFVSSRQASVGYNIVFPRIIPRFSFIPDRFREATTSLAFNLSNTNRVTLYDLTTFNTYWQYQYTRRNKFYAIKFPNIEYALLNAEPDLKNLFVQYPGLKNLFNDGLVVSAVGSFTINGGKGKNVNTFQTNIEASGLPGNSEFIKKNIYRFVKTDVEFKRLSKVGNGDFVTRIFAGVGIPIKVDTGLGYRSAFLPFFKAYSAGGPNSMRGWGLRRLGPGHALVNVSQFPDRFGDIQFETNLEYRFFLFKLFGYKFNSTFFTDIGNVWFMRKNVDFPGGEFSFDHFLKDLGIDVGTGLRVDLGFFLIRLDYALKVHNPTPEPINAPAQDHYFYNWDWKYLWGGVMQFGVTYPF